MQLLSLLRHLQHIPRPPQKAYPCRGAQQIIVLEVAHVEDDLASSSSVSENAELATEESALEEATGE